MQASTSFELAREGRTRPANLLLATPSSSASKSAASEASRTDSAHRRSAYRSSDRPLASPSFNASLSLSHFDNDDVFARPSKAVLATACPPPPHLKSSKALEERLEENIAKSANGQNVRMIGGLPPTPITASNASFSGSPSFQLPGVDQMLAGSSSTGTLASPPDSLLSTPVHEPEFANALGLSFSGGSNGHFARAHRQEAPQPISNMAGGYHMHLPPLPLKSPLKVKERRRKELPSPEDELSMGMTKSASGEFMGPRAEWTSPSKAHTLMDVRAPSPPRRAMDEATTSISPTSWSRQPRDGQTVGLGLELDITPRASLLMGQAAQSDSHVAMGIPFMAPALPGAPRLGVLSSGRFDSLPHHDGAVSPVLPSIRGWNTDLRFNSSSFRPTTSAEGSSRAPAMERERTIKLEGDFPRVHGLRGLGIHLFGNGGEPRSSVEAAAESSRAPMSSSMGSASSSAALSPALSSGSISPALSSASVQSDATCTPARASSISAPSGGHTSPTLPFSLASSGLTPSLKAAHISPPIANPSPSFREQSKMRSRQLVDTATSAVAAVAVVQQATNTANTAASVLTGASERKVQPPSSAAEDNTSAPSVASADAVARPSHTGDARSSAASIAEERILADSSPWGVFSVNKAWRPLAPPGVSATAFVKKQKRSQKATTAERLPPSKQSSTAAPKKQKTALGVKNVNISGSASPDPDQSSRKPSQPIIGKDVFSASAVSPRKRFREHSATGMRTSAAS